MKRLVYTLLLLSLLAGPGSTARADDWDTPVPVEGPAGGVISPARGSPGQMPRPAPSRSVVVGQRAEHDRLSEEGGVLTPERAVALAVRADADLVVARRRLDTLKAEAAPLRQWQDPQLRLEYDTSRRPGDEADRRREAGDVAFRFFTPHVWSAPHEMRAARWRIEAQEAHVASHAWRISCRVRGRLLELSYLDRKWRLQRVIEDERRLRKQREAALRAAGEGQALESIRGGVRHMESRAGRRHTQAELKQGIFRLRRMLGIRDRSAWRLPSLPFSQLVVLPSLLDELEAIEYGMRHREDLRAAELEVLVARALYEAERRKRVPWFDFVQVGYSRRDLRERDADTWSVQAGMELPLMSAANTGEGSAPALAVREADAHLERVRAAIEDEIEQAFLAYHEAHRAWSARQHDLVDLANLIRETMDEMTASFGPGHEELSWLREQRVALRLEALEAEYVLRRAALYLQETMGRVF